MRSIPRHLVPPLVGLIILGLAVVPSWADDEDGDGESQQGELEGTADEGTGSSEDGDAVGEGQAEGEAGEEGEEGEPRVLHPEEFENAPEGAGQEPPEGLEWAPEFHPIYKVEHTRDQDVGSWSHNFTLAYPLSQKLQFRATSAINTRENDALNRLNRQENWTAGMDINVNPALSTGLKFRRIKHIDVKNQGAANEVRSFREKESVDLSTSLHKSYWKGVDVTLGATAGLEKNEYADVRSRGSAQSITAALKYTPMTSLKTDFSYSGNHSLLDSKQGALESTDESVDHRLSSRVEYNWGGHKITMDLGRSTGTKEYPKEQQTEVRDQENESASVTATLALLDGLRTQIGFNYSRNQSYYKVEPSKNNDISTRAVDAHLTYDVGQTSFKADLASQRKRSEYFDVQTGDNHSNSLTLTLTQKLGTKLEGTLKGRTSLLSFQYDDIVGNDQDRDLFDRDASLALSYKPRDDITMSLSLKVREDNTIYIRRSRSGDNKTTQRYAIEPTIRKRFTPRVSVHQRYELSADYTFYEYDPDANFLIRNMSVTTGVGLKPMGSLDLDVSHTYRTQDEGSYVEDEFGEEKYGRGSERVDQKVAITLRYKIVNLVNIEVKQDYSVQQKWRIQDDGSKVPTWDKFAANITGKASADYTLDDGTKLEASIARTHRDATSISERQREVWNISVKLNRTF